MKRPWDIGIRITWKCNLRCIMCDIWKHQKGKEELSTEQVFDIIEEARDWGVKYFVLSGGEPMLRRDLFTIIERASAKGIHVCMTTNGLLIDQEKARRLVDAGLHSIDVSLDGATAETNDKIRGIDGGYWKIIRAIEALLDQKKLEIWIATVIMNQNLEELVPLAEFALDFGLPIKYQPVVVWDFTPLLQNRNAERSPLWIGKDRWPLMDSVLDELIAFKQERGTVNNPVEMLECMKTYFRGQFHEDCIKGGSMALESNGDVLPCWYWRPVGNVRGGKLREVWNSPALEDAFRKMSHCPRKCMLNCHFPADPIDRGLRSNIRKFRNLGREMAFSEPDGG